jgi:hypothetical protein
MMATRLRWAASYRSLAHLRAAGAGAGIAGAGRGGQGGQGGMYDLVGAVVKLLV